MKLTKKNSSVPTAVKAISVYGLDAPTTDICIIPSNGGLLGIIDPGVWQAVFQASCMGLYWLIGKASRTGIWNVRFPFRELKNSFSEYLDLFRLNVKMFILDF